MKKEALGLVEVIGKLAAIEAADTGLKAANVVLEGIENATGAFITIKFGGDVGAIKAATSAAEVSARRVGEVVSVHIIPRPAARIGDVFCPQAEESGADEEVTDEGEGISSPVVEEVPAADVTEAEVTAEQEASTDKAAVEEAETPKASGAQPSEPDDVISDGITQEDAEIPEENRPVLNETNSTTRVFDRKKREDKNSVKAYTCNLCKDPDCPRQKGQSSKLCIHAKDKQK